MSLAELVAVNTDEEARRLRFPGSPTLRVDGKDLFPVRLDGHLVSLTYSNYHHGREHAAQLEALSEDFLRRFCVIGSPDKCIECLCRLVDLGLSHLVIVGGSRDIDVGVRERSDHLVAKEVLPALQALA